VAAKASPEHLVACVEHALGKLGKRPTSPDVPIAWLGKVIQAVLPPGKLAEARSPAVRRAGEGDGISAAELFADAKKSQREAFRDLDRNKPAKLAAGGGR